MVNKPMSITRWTQALALLEVKIPLQRICKIIKLSLPTIYCIQRGYNSAIDTVFQDSYFTDAAWTGRLKVFDEEIEQAVLEYVQADCAGRKSSIYELARQFGMSHNTAWRILCKHAYKKRKPTWKPGLTQAMQAARLRFALDHQYWTLEN